MAKVIFYIERRTSENRIPALMWMLNFLLPGLTIKSSKEKILFVEGIDENLINSLIILVSDFYFVTFVEIFTESSSKKLDAACISEILHSKADIEDLRPALTKLENSISWARNIKKASTKSMVDLIFSSIHILSMRYSVPVEPIDVKVGDIVEINFGFNLPGETSGNHAHAIICFIENDLVSAVPIVRKSFVDKVPHTCTLDINPNEDVCYSTSKLAGGIALLRECKRVRLERINFKIGTLNSDFMAKLLEELPKAFDFRNN